MQFYIERKDKNDSYVTQWSGDNHEAVRVL